MKAIHNCCLALIKFMQILCAVALHFILILKDFVKYSISANTFYSKDTIFFRIIAGFKSIATKRSPKPFLKC